VRNQVLVDPHDRVAGRNGQHIWLEPQALDGHRVRLWFWRGRAAGLIVHMISPSVAVKMDIRTITLLLPVDVRERFCIGRDGYMSQPALDQQSLVSLSPALDRQKRQQPAGQ
jgi:hypothetical protein